MGELLVEFDVIGVPKPQGSKTAFNAKGTGRAMTKETGGVGFAAWRNAVSEAARRARDEYLPLPVLEGLGFAETKPPFDGPLVLIAQFRFPMPPSRKKAERQRGWMWKTTAPDESKLIRLIEDSMQAAGLIADDARFAQHFCEKVELVDQWIGVRIRIEALCEERPMHHG